MYGQYGNFNSYAMGAAPQMQQRLSYLQQQQQQTQMPAPQIQPTQFAMTAPQQILKGRIVTGVDEAKAAQIDFDGSSTFFPCPAEGKIYEKFLGLDGLPVFRVYQIAQAQEPKQPVYAERSYVDNLIKRVDNLEKALGGVQNEPDAITDNVSEQR